MRSLDSAQQPVSFHRTSINCFCTSHSFCLLSHVCGLRRFRRCPGSHALHRYLVDELPESKLGALVEAYPARTLVFTSPRGERFKKFLDEPNSYLKYMATWSWDEIIQCRDLLFRDDPNRSFDLVERLFSQWGGIPRYVLEKTEVKDAQQRLNTAIYDCVGLTVSSLISADQPSFQASLRLFHIYRDAEFDFRTVNFASDYVAKAVIERQLTYGKERLEDFVQQSTNLDVLAEVRGRMFEALAHATLCNGGTFLARDLSSGVEVSVTLPAFTMMKFTLRMKEKAGNKADPETQAFLASLTKCLSGTATSNVYFVPESTNFPAIDAFAPSHGAFQMKASKKATEGAVTPSQFDKLWQYARLSPGVAGLQTPTDFGAVSNNRLFIVVPEDVYPKLTAKIAISGSGSPLSRLKQYALKIPARSGRPSAQPPATPTASIRRRVMGARQRTSWAVLGVRALVVR